MDLPIENGGSFHSYVSLPEGIYTYIDIYLCATSSIETYYEYSMGYFIGYNDVQ